MVDMNVIVLEGVGLYIALAIVLFMVISIAALAWSGIKQDEKIEILTEQLHIADNLNRDLNRENMRYKLKYGALDVGTTSPPPAAEPLLKEKP